MATVKYSATTGKKLKAGEKTTDAKGNTYTQGKDISQSTRSSSSGGGSSSSSSSSKAPSPADYNPNTGTPMKAGETASKDGVNYVGTGAKISSTSPTTTAPSSAPGTAKFGDQGQYTYKVDSKGIPYGAPLPTATAPNDPSKINQTTGVNMPTNLPGIGNVNNASASSAGATSFIETQEQIAKDRQAEVKANQDALAKETTPLLKKLLGGNSPSEARKDAQNETGIDPENYFAEQKSKIAEIETLTTDYNKEKATMEAAILAQQDRMATTGNISGGVAKIQRDYAPKLNMMSANINAKAATLQALQGNFNTAQDFVNQAVQDATAEQKYNMDLYSTFYQINKDTIDSLDEPYKKAYESAMKMSEVAYEQAVDEANATAELMMDNPKAGITITDTFASAAQKVTRSGGSLNYRQEQRLSGGGGGSGSGGATIYDSAIEIKLSEGLSPSQAALEVYTDLGENLTEKEKTALLNRATTLSKNMKPVAPPAPALAPAPVTVYGAGKSLGDLNREAVTGTGQFLIDYPTTIYKGIGNFFKGLGGF